MNEFRVGDSIYQISPTDNEDIVILVKLIEKIADERLYDGYYHELIFATKKLALQQNITRDEIRKRNAKARLAVAKKLLKESE